MIAKLLVIALAFSAISLTAEARRGRGGQRFYKPEITVHGKSRRLYHNQATADQFCWVQGYNYGVIKEIGRTGDKHKRWRWRGYWDKDKGRHYIKRLRCRN